MRVLGRGTIATLLPGIDLIAGMEQAFVAASRGEAQIARVAELLFDQPPGDVHIKAGHLAGAPCYVVKVASGFYANPAIGLPSSSGLMLLFSAQTGTPQALLLDEGLLTDERTAAAGAVAAKWLAPRSPECIGMLGAGIQAERQLAHLRGVTDCRAVMIWARREEAALALADKAAALGYAARVAASPAAVAEVARLIVTTTPSETPLLHAADIRPGTHITAVGADSPHKAELADDLLALADIRIADNVAQSRERGEFRRLAAAALVGELGALIAGSIGACRAPADICIADLTGVAVQDAAIAQAVFAASCGAGDQS